MQPVKPRTAYGAAVSLAFLVALGSTAASSPVPAKPHKNATQNAVPPKLDESKKEMVQLARQLAQSDVEGLPKSRLLISPPPRNKPTEISTELLPRPRLRPREAAATFAAGQWDSSSRIITPTLKPSREAGDHLEELGSLDAGDAHAIPLPKPLRSKAAKPLRKTTPSSAELNQADLDRPPSAAVQPGPTAAIARLAPQSEGAAVQSLTAPPNPTDELLSTVRTKEIAESASPVSQPILREEISVPPEPSAGLLAPVGASAVGQASDAHTQPNPSSPPEIAKSALEPVVVDEPSSAPPDLLAQAQAVSPPDLTTMNVAVADRLAGDDDITSSTAPSDPLQTATLPSASEGQVLQELDIAKTEEIDWAALRIVFAPGVQTIGDDAKTKLLALRDWLVTHKDQRIRLDAYASDTADPISKARRISLSRAIAVRSYLIEQGVRATRINLRARGNLASEGPPDRVDIHPADR